MKIILFDIDNSMVDCWKRDFAGLKDVCIENMEFSEFMKSRRYSIDMVVSAANSFGIMNSLF